MGIGEYGGYGEYGVTNRVHEPVLTRPLLRFKSDPSQNQMPSTRTQNSTHGDRLFLRSLGLLLAELWLGQRAGSDDNSLQSIEREAGPRYAEAVRFCFRGIIDPEASIVKIEDFRSKIETEVVLKLIQNLNEHKLMAEKGQGTMD
jgi:hypothetical protein